MENIIKTIEIYGLDNVIMAILIIIVTGFIKIPFKLITNKYAAQGINLNKYITLIPFILGVVFAACYTYFTTGLTWWDANTLSHALTSATLSLSIYAIADKFFEKSKKTDLNTKDEKIQISQIVANDENKDIPQIEENSGHMIVRR